VISLPFCLLRQAQIRTQVITSLTSGVPLPSLVPTPCRVPLCIRGLHPNSPGGWVPPPEQAIHWRLVRSSPSSPGDASWQQGRWQITVSTIPDEPPRNVAGISSWDMGHWGSLAGTNFYYAGTDSEDLCPRLSPENKEVSPYIPLQAGYRSKRQSSIHIWLHVTSLDISFPQCYVTFFKFQFFKFYLSALPSLPSASFSKCSLSVSLLVFLPTTLSLSM
jgi:hypothetical protein